MQHAPRAGLRDRHARSSGGEDPCEGAVDRRRVAAAARPRARARQFMGGRHAVGRRPASRAGRRGARADVSGREQHAGLPRRSPSSRSEGLGRTHGGPARHRSEPPADRRRHRRTRSGACRRAAEPRRQHLGPGRRAGAPVGAGAASGDASSRKASILATGGVLSTTACTLERPASASTIGPVGTVRRCLGARTVSSRRSWARVRRRCGRSRRTLSVSFGSVATNAAVQLRRASSPPPQRQHGRDQRDAQRAPCQRRCGAARRRARSRRDRRRRWRWSRTCRRSAWRADARLEGRARRR